MAKKMGLPVSRFICASNKNNILTEFLNTGIYDISNKKLIKTDSPSIDILKSSNIERLLYFITEDANYIKNLFEALNTNKKFTIPSEILAKIQENFVADFCSEEEMQKTIQKYHAEHNILLDPHTAVAICVSNKTPQENSKQRVIASTAHFGKFIPAIEKALHNTLENISHNSKNHANLEKLSEKESVQTDFISGEYSEILNAVENFINR